MDISPRKKKWLKIISISIGVLLLVAVVLYYTTAFRLKQAIRIIVDKESNGIYTFNASVVYVSLSKRHIKIKNAELRCRDTANTTPHYDVKIPEIFLSLPSLKTMILPEQLVIDSLAIALPQIKIHEHSKRETQPAAFHASNILDMLQRLKSKLQVRSFSIRNASFNYGNIFSQAQFKSNRISLVVKDFSKDNDSSKSFLSSDDVDLSIAEQQWEFFDGSHQISFSNLHFSGANQYFQIDSCRFSGKNKQGSAFSISAQMLFFNSSRLTDFYNKEALILDTVLLYKPLIQLEASEREKKEDSASIVVQSIKQFLKSINCRFIDIIDGGIRLNQKNSEHALFATEGANFKIYNLGLNRDSAGVQFDSISLLQKNVNLITKDSLFKLNIAAFAIERNTLLLRNVTYGPTEKNQSAKHFTFKSPLLKLNNIKLGFLLEKKLDADDAELYEPQISFKTELKKEQKNKTPIKIGEEKFYNTLNGLSELLFVKAFRIINGNLVFQSIGASPIDLRMKSINALLLPDQLFLSDSLIDVKRSIPEIAIGSMQILLPKATLNIAGFAFEGEIQKNHTTKLELELANGTRIKGKDITWQTFDWDKYYNSKELHLNTMQINELAITTRPRMHSVKEHIAKDLPVIHIDRIDIDKVKVDQSGTNSFSLQGQQVRVDNISSLKHAFTWKHAEGLFHNIEINQPGFIAKAASVNLNTQSKSNVSETEIQIKNPGSLVQIAIPHISTDFRLHSSDFDSIDLSTLDFLNPDINIQKTKAEKTEDITSAPSTEEKQTALSIGKMSIQNGRVQYSNANAADPILIKSGISVEAEKFLYSNSKAAILSWSLLELQLAAAHLKMGNTKVDIPGIDIELNTGKLFEENKLFNLNTLLSLNWNDAKVNSIKTDSTGITIDKLSGSIQSHPFTFQQTKKINWKKYIPLLLLNGGTLFYKFKESSVSASGIAYNGETKHINISTVKFSPDANTETYFKQKGWQASYTSIETGNINISGIRLKEDSIFNASKLIVDEPMLFTMRDKRYPLKHGIEKPMLAKMINDLKVPINIDSVLINNGTIAVHEITEKTHKEAFIPLKEINAVATHVRNRNNKNDSLNLFATLKLYNTKAQYFHYAEAYGDSLSAFSLQLRVSPIMFPELSPITMSFANANVVNGKADTLYADWVGNKYAAAGRMNFIYDGLKIKLMSKKDSSRTTFFGRMFSFLANDIAIHKKNDKPALIFFVRDREKSVFNYWIKTKLNGVFASVAILQRERHIKEYSKKKRQYNLPEIEITKQ